jgi:hypothetical protein
MRTVFVYDFRKEKTMVKGCSLLIVGFLLLLSLPICIGIGGGIFGMFVGLIGGAFGLIFGVIGAIIGFIAEIFSAIMHGLFGWHHHGFHPWHFNGFGVLAVIVLIFVLATRNKKQP